jgi:two-component system C4-dicarboxylate transport sensor histidine kinase DctB
MRFARPYLLFVLLLVGAAALLAWSANRWATVRALSAADAAAEQAAGTHGGLLSSELQKFRLLPLVLIEYPDVTAALSGADPAASRRLNATLELLANRTDAAAIYAIDANGRTVAASNWRTPASFVGQNYGFRPYFRNAMKAGASELFALGTVSGRPGLYLARRVDRDGRALGTVVVKVEFDALEAAWARTRGVTMVTDQHGVILITSQPAWRFRATGKLDAATLADARRTLQFGLQPPGPAPLSMAPPDAVADGVQYRVSSIGAPLAGARLAHLSPVAPQLAAARSQALLWALGILILVGIASGFTIRSAERRRLQREARVALEAEVVRRTAELREANSRLTIESEERAEADRRFRAAREELAQANRLGSLGQITAGVAHEINQPVAAIRTFAENGSTFLERGLPDAARENLGRIVDLTERIGTITAELRAFARKRTPAGGKAILGSVLDGVLLLIGERARAIVRLDVPAALRKLAIVGDRTRLEQVLINLIQNAIEAIGDDPGAGVTIGAAKAKQTIKLSVTDAGPGLDPAIAATLFTPFTSGKPDGLGLGLAIARDIAREFGGDLTHVPGKGGATFLVTLRIAE